MVFYVGQTVVVVATSIAEVHYNGKVFLDWSYHMRKLSYQYRASTTQTCLIVSILFLSALTAAGNSRLNLHEIRTLIASYQDSLACLRRYHHDPHDL
jgi:hypothetical protein